MLLFAAMRLIYLAVLFSYIKPSGFLSVMAVFYHSLRLDISTACYILVFQFLLIILQSIKYYRLVEIIHRIYVLAVTFVFILITIAETGLYPEWKTKLHYKALLYLGNPGEIIRTAETWQLIVMLMVLPLFTIAFFYIYRRFFSIKFDDWKRNLWVSAGFFIITPLLLFTGMRGGWQQIPINQSRSYFSDNDMLNLASVNSGWNLLHSIIQNKGIADVNPYTFYPKEFACQKVKDLYAVGKDSTLMMLNNQKPNIVFFILEGWSADLIESCGGEKGITPFFHELEKQGVLFTNAISSGTRSQQGMAAIFSGFPSHPLTTVTEQPEKCISLPSLARDLKDVGYNTSFYFGGDLTYGNILSYLMQTGFELIKDENDFPAEMPSGKLGIHDEFSFPYFLQQLNWKSEPFMASLFTVSTHSPYDMQMPELHQWPEFEKNYVNAASYSDQCLRNYFKEAQKTGWYKNTLFVLISDHGHGSYINRDFYSPEYHKIVFMLCGDVIKPEYRGMKINKVVSQVDVPVLLLHQMGLNYQHYPWGKNVLNEYSPGFAFYSFEEGFGWVNRNSRYVYDHRIKKDVIIEIDTAGSIDSKLLIEQGKSYLQCVFDNYMNL